MGKQYFFVVIGTGGVGGYYGGLLARQGYSITSLHIAALQIDPLLAGGGVFARQLVSIRDRMVKEGECIIYKLVKKAQIEWSICILGV